MADRPGTSSTFSLSEIMTLYGLSLMVCGALAFQASGLERKALSSVFVGNGGAVLCFLLAAGMRNPAAEKGTGAYKLLMVCVHVAFVFPVAMAAVVAWRLAKAWPVEEKHYMRPYLGYMIVTSLATALTVLRKKPKKSDAAAAQKKEDDQSGGSQDAKTAKAVKKAGAATADAPAPSVRRRARRAAAE